MKNSKIKNMVLCALFAALIAVGAYIRIPTPTVPMTLQVEFAILAGLLLGKKWGLTAGALYMFIGLAGVPVFTSGGGLGCVLTPSFGYVIGFSAGAWTAGAIAGDGQKPSLIRLLGACGAGLLCVYFCGTLYYYLISTFVLGAPIGVWPLILNCFLIFLPGDTVMCALFALLAKRLLPLIRR